MRPILRLFGFAFLFLATASPLSGQVLRGIVVEAGTGAEVAGALVVLLDADDRTRATSLSDSRGRFLLAAPRAGRWRLRADRIGHASTLSPVLELAAGDTLEHRLEVSVEPVTLEGLVVRGSRRCTVRPEEGVEAALLWEEVRKALAAAAWTDEMGLYRYRLTHFERELDPGRPVARNERSERAQGFWRAPFESLEAQDLVHNGFVREGDGGLIYSAPDADVLLSDVFLDTHCFRAHGQGDDEEVRGLLGLAFEPVPGRRNTPEIEGVLWVDPGTAELRRLEYEYTHLGSVGMAPGEGWAGGTVLFEAMPNGAWIIREWAVRMPVIRETWVQRPGVPGGYRGHEVVSIREQGGRVDGVSGGLAAVDSAVAGGSRVSGRSGVVARGGAVADADHVVHGAVREWGSEEPMAGALVELLDDGGGRVAGGQTNASGRFRVAAPGVGGYRLRVTHLGYRDALSERFTLDGTRGEVELGVELAVEPILLEPLEVTAERESLRLAEIGFYRREEMGFGQFVVADEIEARSPRQVTDLLYGRPGVRVVAVNAMAGIYDVVMSGGSSMNVRGHCYPLIALDGMVVRPGGVPTPVGPRDAGILEPEPGQWNGLVHPAEIAGIEVYPRSAGLPVQFGGNRSPCGAILIWTKR